MMDKAANRKRETRPAPSGDIHSQISKEATKLRNAARNGIQEASLTPALSALLDSARSAIEQSIPTSFEHEGRTYWLRAALLHARLMVFDAPATCSPMAFAVSGSSKEFGHDPGH